MQLLFEHFVMPFTNLKRTHIHECNFCMYLGYYYLKSTSFDTSWNIAWRETLEVQEVQEWPMCCVLSGTLTPVSSSLQNIHMMMQTFLCSLSNIHV